MYKNEWERAVVQYFNSVIKLAKWRENILNSQGNILRVHFKRRWSVQNASATLYLELK